MYFLQECVHSCKLLLSAETLLQCATLKDSLVEIYTKQWYNRVIYKNAFLQEGTPFDIL